MKNVIKHNIQHQPSEELFVPLIAVENNIDFLTSKSKKLVIFTDVTEKEVKEWKEINILSGEGKQLVSRIYGISWHKFLEVWYSKCYFDSLSFLYINFKN